MKQLFATVIGALTMIGAGGGDRPMTMNDAPMPRGSVPRWVTALLVMACCLLGCVSAHAQRIALVIGNAAYVGAKPLRNPGNDADDVAVSLRRLGFTVQRHVDLPRREMNRVVADFTRSAARAELAIVFYSGHGMQTGGETFLIPVDARIDSDQDLRSEGLRLGELMNDLEGQRIRNTLIIVDACRDNPFTLGTKSAARGLARPPEMSGAFLVAYATADGRTAGDGNGRNGVYTTQLLRQWELGGATRNLRDLMEDTQLAVEDATDQMQRPKIYGDTARFRNVFLGSGKADASPVAAAPSLPSGAAPVANRPSGLSAGGRPTIAVAGFDGEGVPAAEVVTVVEADLKRGGLSDVLGGGGTTFSETQRLDTPLWARVGATYVVGGSVRKLQDGRLDVRFRAWRMNPPTDLGGQAYVVGSRDLRLAAHRISDWLQQEISGVPGTFSASVARVESLPGGHFALVVSDSDGANPAAALKSPWRIGLPVWSDSNRQLAYVSLENGRPQVFVHVVADGKRRVSSRSADVEAACSREIALWQGGGTDAADRYLRDDWARQGAGPCHAALKVALQDG